MLERLVRESPDEALFFLRYISSTATESSYREFRRAILEHVPAAEAPLATIADELKQEGRLEGRQEGLREILRLQLQQRFGALDPARDALIATATLDELQRAVGRVLVAPDAGSVFQSH